MINKSLRTICTTVAVAFVLYSPACADTQPVQITSAGDLVNAVGDPSLPDQGAASDVGQSAANSIDGTSAKYYNRSVYKAGYTGSGFINSPVSGPSIVTAVAISLVTTLLTGILPR